MPFLTPARQQYCLEGGHSRDSSFVFPSPRVISVNTESCLWRASCVPGTLGGFGEVAVNTAVRASAQLELPF